MQGKDEKGISVDILKHIEDLSNQVNRMMASRARAVFRRYPVTFGLMILIGVMAVHEGLKGLMREFGLLNINPWYLLVAGLAILTITGTLYKKLEK
ncbi:MAG: hypothetical protein UU82_C0011G0010 [Candidatus Nomurabacteria bacterium GW2011_GWC2_41_8]|uniref:Uncharacterized protein n=3 Tax=Candidatus Nomuraibacteriota TaxID=1752729 RepID=A0A1F6YC14_9BACT|nr:MAG: hypothetical protein UU58_C0008G0016 [Candidatus Nomurabacteria bacterium GW2011_GWA2_41_25]KKS24114.1 MAG: hypothetical protein UU82_C0011G0010 [Candidatus Nomurabacteria bacterium GW2011_GWC2_41_8]OGI66713.1 MAG: hypothetical protein A2823_00750 [Candidatus Nomurabacteria bacterium RIFCSPHIGHO2_01_FULL_41_91]OGI80365.1 MAG: hypothetical protein A3D43_02175 [Candidatus Nomurabacteria bacterium RIFCSPHIGHO2_02_FULL_41_52]OGI85334.1 MAG: hypothetical protein A3F49_01395 [Candidatus Nomur